MRLLCTLRQVFRSFETSSVSFTAPLKMPRRRKHGLCYDANDQFALSNVVKKLESFAPLHLAEPWDNVGLLVEPPLPVAVKRILLTNDLTEEVLSEAIGNHVQLIISYHPLIFPHIKSLNARSWKERILGNLLQRQIALYSPHTAWDSVEGGVNDWLASAFGQESIVKPLKPHNDGKKVEVIQALFPNAELAEQASKSIEAAVAGSIQGFNLNDGKVSLQIHTDNKYLVLPHIGSAIITTFSHLMNLPTSMIAGVGRLVTLKEKISLQKVIALVKAHLGLADLSVAVIPEEDPETTLVGTIAICAGSGGSVLKGVDADLYLTGEMSHHEVLDAVHKGIHVILTRHSNSERGFLDVAAKSYLKTFYQRLN